MECLRGKHRIIYLFFLELYFLFENYDSLLLGYFGTIMLEGFEQGYKKPIYKITKNQVEEIIEEHIKAYTRIFQRKR
jgi:hypothetical protein